MNSKLYYCMIYLSILLNLIAIYLFIGNKLSAGFALLSAGSLLLCFSALFGNKGGKNK